ncbi:MAG: DnaJ domain-containing protein [Hyphomicrobiales bacterium]|nr:DnaJ domain-containing protein [Hyphomicrobiales bacterium]MDE2286368.1 DnaJ domain-containing protein [Hyphomicrobiales bacterium]MDE2374087.1 DnaJ domain-containing protein [Hyphomicrobiales bacterium]
MSTNSPLFDRIRVKPDQDRTLKTELPPCQWPRCDAPATHRAPKGRLRASEYWRFCLDHVREYNNSYNFFAGMSDDAIAKYQKEDITGHRPTWKMGSVGGVRGSRGKSRRNPGASRGPGWAADDPFNLFEGMAGGPTRQSRPAAEGRKILNAQRRALDVLGLEGDAARADIKAKFKVLVKRHHPDANGGDRGSEDRLREIIQAYNYLKSAGFC